MTPTILLRSKSLRSLIEVLESRIAPATFLITSFKDSGDGSLRQAISDANASADADTIFFNSSGNIKLASSLPAITADLTITAQKPVTVDGQKNVQLFSIIGDDVDVTIEGFKLIGGRAASGAAVMIDSPGADILIRKSSISGNVAAIDPNEESTGDLVSGGAITNLNAALVLDQLIISGNSSVAGQLRSQGGAIYNLGTLDIKNSAFSNNFAIGATAQGGAIFSGDKTTVAISNSKFIGNTAMGISGSKVVL